MELNRLFASQKSSGPNVCFVPKGGHADCKNSSLKNSRCGAAAIQISVGDPATATVLEIILHYSEASWA
jgi:hypothetical protein